MRADLGKRYRDIASGFEGMATARAEYLAGEPKVMLTRLGKDDKPAEVWIPEGRLEMANGAEAGHYV